jgi:hypothetical protein
MAVRLMLSFGANWELPIWWATGVFAFSRSGKT